MNTSRCAITQSQGLERQKHVHPVLEARQIATGQLLNAFDPVANGVDVQMQRLRRTGPGTRAGEECLERGEQVGMGTAVVLEDRSENTVGVRTPYVVGQRRE